MAQQSVNRQDITVPAEAGDRAQADASQQRFLPKRLASMHIREMRFDNGQFNGAYGIAEGDGSVRIGAGVKDHAVRPCARIVKLVNQCAFVIGLRRAQLDIKGGDMPRDRSVDIRQRHAPVNLRLPRAEQIEVGSVQQQDAFCS